MLKKFCFLFFCFSIISENAVAWSISLPPETKELSEKLTDCTPFNYVLQNKFDINLVIKGKESDYCVLELKLADLENKQKTNERIYFCKVSDFNIEEIKLTFEEATVVISGINKSKDESIIEELFESFKRNNICK